MEEFEEADYSHEKVSDDDSESPPPTCRRRSPSLEKTACREESSPQRVDGLELNVGQESGVCLGIARSAGSTGSKLSGVGRVARGSVASLIQGLHSSPQVAKARPRENVQSKPPPYKAFPGKRKSPAQVASESSRSTLESPSADCTKSVELRNIGDVSPQSVNGISCQSNLTDTASGISCQSSITDTASVESSSRDSLATDSKDAATMNDHVLVEDATNMEPSNRDKEPMTRLDAVQNDLQEMQTSNFPEPPATESSPQQDLISCNGHQVDLSASDDEEALPQNDISTSACRGSESVGDMIQEQPSCHGQRVKASEHDLEGENKPQPSDVDSIADADMGLIQEPPRDFNSEPCGQADKNIHAAEQEDNHEHNNEDDEDDDCMILEVTPPPIPLHIPSQEEIAEAERLEGMRKIVSLTAAETVDENERLAARAARFGTTVSKVATESIVPSSGPAISSGRNLSPEEDDDLPPLPEVILFKDKAPFPKASGGGTGFLATLLNAPILSHRIMPPPPKKMSVVPMSSSSSSGSATPVPKAKKMPRIEKKTMTAGESDGHIATNTPAETTLAFSDASQNQGNTPGSPEMHLESVAVPLDACRPPHTQASVAVGERRTEETLAPAPIREQGACWQWDQFANCKYGSACKFAHNTDARKQLLRMRRRLGDVDLVPDWKRLKTAGPEAPRRAPNFGLREECGEELPLFEDSDLGAYIDSALLQGDVMESAETIPAEAEVDPYLDAGVDAVMTCKEAQAKEHECSQDDLGEKRAAAFRQAFEELPE